MGLMDILNGMQNGPRGQTDPNAKGGMSPITMALLALLAYKAYQKSGIGTGAPAPAPAPGRIPDRNTIDASLPSGSGMGAGLDDLLKGGLGGLLGGLAGGAPQGRLPGGRAAAPSGGGLDDLSQRRAWRSGRIARRRRRRQRARQRARWPAQANAAEGPRRRHRIPGSARDRTKTFPPTTLRARSASTTSTHWRAAPACRATTCCRACSSNCPIWSTSSRRTDACRPKPRRRAGFKTKMRDDESRISPRLIRAARRARDLVRVTSPPCRRPRPSP